MKILVPVDYSEHSQVALGYAVFLARGLGPDKATLDVVHIWDRPSYVPENVMVGKPGSQKSLVDLIRDNAEAEMADFLERCLPEAGVTVTHHLESGEPSSAILRTAKSSNADLVVIGSHGRTGVRYLLLGSVAEKLVRLCPMPVICVPHVS
jgi:nucleotide-binding universal stress UspA family protein